MLCPDSISTILMSQHPGMRSQVHLRKHHYKASGGDGIPVELFQILKDDAVQVLYSICQQIWKNSTVATGLEKVSFHSNPKERQCQRMLKILQVRLHSTRTMNFQMFKQDLEKAEEPEMKLPTSVGSLKKQEGSRKTSISALLTMPKPLRR